MDEGKKVEELLAEKVYTDLKDYKDELMNKLIELDKVYIEKELKTLRDTALDANKLSNIHNFRKSNLTLLLRTDLIGNEQTIVVEEKK